MKNIKQKTGIDGLIELLAGREDLADQLSEVARKKLHDEGKAHKIELWRDTRVSLAETMYSVLRRHTEDVATIESILRSEKLIPAVLSELPKVKARKETERQQSEMWNRLREEGLRPNGRNPI